MSLAFLGTKTGKALVSGAASIAATKIALGDKGSANIGGMQVPFWALSGAVGAGASALADVATAYALPHVLQSENLRRPETALMSAGFAGAATVGFYKAIGALDGSGFSWKEAFAIGVVSEALAVYAYNETVLPLFDPNIHA